MITIGVNGYPVPLSRWNASPDTRMMQLLHDTGIRLGLVTNGDHWMLVNAKRNETSGYVSWYANLWLEESLTLRAFRTLLGAHRFFGVQDTETLDLKDGLLDRSAEDQQEVTDQLGYQVRKAVEVLIQALDKADQDHGRKLLAHVDEKVLYEAALTVMMRLVFLFCAEERELLLLGDDLYDKSYAVSTLREQLRATADQHGEEILGLRYDAWTRLLTTFRAVYAGAKHDRLKLPAYGGSLFHPDRFPFLEGRSAGTTWTVNRGPWTETDSTRSTVHGSLPTFQEATPLPVSNRTVLHLLKALQVLQVRLPGGGPAEARTLSFRSLDIEQIGHVYEGLLDHTAKRATEPVLGLQGTRDKEPEISLATLEREAWGQSWSVERGPWTDQEPKTSFWKFLKEQTGRSEAALKKAFSLRSTDHDPRTTDRFRTACQDSQLWKKAKPFAGLVRLDTTGYPVVITPGSVFVTAGTDRRSSGTHYTPKSLTEPIVQYTLEPLVFEGPAEGWPKSDWRLRSAKELLALKVCDMACGSGAFLVEACRYLAARLQEAWLEAQRTHPDAPGITPDGSAASGHPIEQIIPASREERHVYALRLVAQRCIYGVDKNPLAAEMAKLSLWLLTLAKDKPFEFLDHAIRCGDSLVGIHSLDQLRKFNLDGIGENNSLFLQFLDPRIKEAIELRRKLEAMQANSVEDVQAQEQLLREANEKMERLKCAADMLVGAEFLRWEQHELIEEELRDEERDDEDGDRPGPSWLKSKKATEQFRRAARTHAAIETAVHFHDSDLDTFRYQCQTWLNGQPTFHWPLEFPEVIVDRGGFDAFVGNPPFMGGSRISGELGDSYREHLVSAIASSKRGNSDLCAFFFLRASHLMRSGGHLGFLATNTIAQGDTREVGLDTLLLGGYSVPRAVPSRKWPGSANLEVAHVWMRRGKWSGEVILDDQPVSAITSYLADFISAASTATQRLAANARLSFNGSKAYGQGFLLSPQQASDLIGRYSKYAQVLFPYLNGEDVTNNVDQSPSRWVINFFDWPLNRTSAPRGYAGQVAADYPECLAIVEAKVKPERERNNRKIRRERWWQFGERASDLYATIAILPRCLVVPIVAKYLLVVWEPVRCVFSHAVAVIASSDDALFSLLQSNVHETWARYCGSTLETRMRYTPSDCFETFPLPHSTEGIRPIGCEYAQHRCQLAGQHHEGLTTIYNRFHDPDETSTDIQKLRQLHVEMDNAVAARLRLGRSQPRPQLPRGEARHPLHDQ